MHPYHSKPHKFLKPGHPDLERGWQSLPGGPSAYHTLSGEVWQYMGTWSVNGRWEHQFRHRWHPYTGQRMIVIVPVGEWTGLYLNFQFWLALALLNASTCWRLISSILRRSISAWAASPSIRRKQSRRI